MSKAVRSLGSPGSPVETTVVSRGVMSARQSAPASKSATSSTSRSTSLRSDSGQALRAGSAVSTCGEHSRTLAGRFPPPFFAFSASWRRQELRLASQLRRNGGWHKARQLRLGGRRLVRVEAVPLSFDGICEGGARALGPLATRVLAKCSAKEVDLYEDLDSWCGRVVDSWLRRLLFGSGS